MRWATPGTEVDCAIQFWLSASATIQSTSTPPPWPPIASTAMESGRVWSIAGGCSHGVHPDSASGEREAAAIAPALQETDDAAAQLRHQPVEAGRIVDDVGAVE